MLYPTTIGGNGKPFKPALAFDCTLFVKEQEFPKEQDAYAVAHAMWTVASKAFSDACVAHGFEPRATV